MKIKLILFIVFALYSYNVNASMYSYVCDNKKCYNTERKEVWDNYYMYKVYDKSVDKYKINKQVIENFTKTFDNYLSKIINDYWSLTIEIEDFCEWNCSNNPNWIDKKFTLDKLINFSTWFYIVEDNWFRNNEILKTYESWHDYLFTNFKKIINELHFKAGLPVWDKKNKLKDIVWNILSYSFDDKKFNLRNVCDFKNPVGNIICKKTTEKQISYGHTDKYKYISWEIKQAKDFVKDTFKVANTYKISEFDDINSDATLIKAWESIIFNFWFEDYLDFMEKKTKYTYKMYYWIWNNIPSETDIPQLSETIVIKNNDLSVSSDWIGDNIDEIVSINYVKDSNWNDEKEEKHINAFIKEWITFSKAGEYNFYLSVINETSWAKMEITKINNISLNVMHNDNIKSWDWNIKDFDVKDNIAQKWYNVDYPFKVEFNLKDSFWNNHFDKIDWYEISLAAWTSDKIELSIDGDDTVYWIWWNSISWIKTWDNSKATFYFRVREPWYHVLNWFNFKIKYKEDESNYLQSNKTTILYWVVPKNLYNGSQKMKMYIKVPVYEKLPITCANQVNINFRCTSDNWSWCYMKYNNDTNYKNFINQSYLNESDNGTKITLKIRDNAYNWRAYSWIMNHVDTKAPTIKIRKGSDVFENNKKYSYLANSDDLVLNFKEITTENCHANLKYELKKNNIFYMSGTLDAVKNWKVSLDQELKIEKFFENSRVSEKLTIKIIDAYWNSYTNDVIFSIYPDLLSENNSTLTAPFNKKDKYANNVDEYTYILNLKDRYDNPIYSKSILLINQDCNNTSGCNTLTTDETNDSWSDTLKEKWLWKTNNDWKINFRIKSLAPWEFTEKFSVKMNNWNNYYVDNNNDKTINIWGFKNTNFFNKPIITKLTIPWVSNPAINTEYKYNINLTNTWKLTSISNWELWVIETSIINKVVWHSWKSFSLIWNKNFSLSNRDLSFSWTVNAISNHTEAIEIWTNKLKISYKLWWYLISYYLDDVDLEWQWCNVETLWVKVYWTLEWEWKSSDVWQIKNFSDLPKAKLRWKIRENAYKLIRNRIHNTTVNWVKFIEWNITITWTPQYETLIVKNWNVIISWDLNTNNKKLWIIVLKDNYDVLSDYETSWNIYVNNSVKIINAIIYADWTFRSANSTWSTYSDASLGIPLKMNWSLFTRNTIWWSIWENTLPWGKLTKDSNLAYIYDLNNVRKQVLKCSSDYAFIIKYNSSIQSNPPKWFDIN